MPVGGAGPQATMQLDSELRRRLRVRVTASKSLAAIRRLGGSESTGQAVGPQAALAVAHCQWQQGPTATPAVSTTGTVPA